MKNYKKKIRNLKISNQILKELSKIINIKYSQLGFITLTYIRLSNNYKYAKIYFNILKNNYKNIIIITNILNDISEYLRFELNKKIFIYYIPKLKFKYDKFINKLKNILNLIKVANLK